MTVTNSVRELFLMPARGLVNGAQPVMGFNYGAHEYKRVKSCIKFTSIASITYTSVMWLLLESFPGFFISIFNNDAEVLQAGIPVMRLFFSSFFIISLQFAGMSAFLALGKSKWAVFFPMLRKIILIIPLAILLPRLWGLGTTGIFLSEAISDFISAIACFITMLLIVWKELGEGQSELMEFLG